MNESDSAGGGATTGTTGVVGSRATTTTTTRGTTAAGLPDRRIVRGEQRRREILRTAVEVFGEQGFRGSSLREIAARVGISEAGLLHHFGSKAGLLTATLEERDRRDLVRRTEDEAAGADLLTTIRDQVRRNAETPGLVSLHVVVAAEAMKANGSTYGLQLQWLLDPDNVDMVALFDQFLALLRPEGTPPAAPEPRTTEQETA